jgi:excinuclease ABC subunit B
VDRKAADSAVEKAFTVSATTDLGELIKQLTEQMHEAAAELQFELAGRLRDEISDLKKELRQINEATK